MNLLNRVLLTVAFALGLTTAALAQQPTPPEHYTLDPRGVDLVAGTFNFGATEVVIGQPGGGGGLSYGRVFIGAGAGWRDTNIGTIEFPLGEVLIAVGPVSEAFVNTGSGWVSKTGNGSIYDDTSLPGYVIVTDRYGVEVYILLDSFVQSNYGGNAVGFLEKIEYPNGRIVEYFYKRQKPGPTQPWALRLQGIRDNQGFLIKYTYYSNSVANLTAWMQVKDVTGINTAVDYCDPSADSCPTFSRTWPSVSYSNQPDLPLTATDQSSRTTTYSYTIYGELDTVRFPGSVADDIDVDYSSGQVSGVTDASGAWTYAYVDVGTTRTTTATGPLSQSVTVVSDLTTGRATSVTDAQSNVTAYQYDADLRITRVTQPEGNYTDLAYDSRGNVTQVTQVGKSGPGASDIVTSSTFPSTCPNPITCNRPTATTDALGNVTDYAWNSTHGGLDSVTYASPDGGTAPRPQTRYGYSAFYAWYKNSGGSIVAAPTPITLPTTVEACITAAPPPSPGGCNGTADELESTIAYGAPSTANNLLPTSVSRGAGDGSLTATTAMTYTADGDVETIDGPLSGSSDTTLYRYDTARQVTGVVGPDPDGGGALLNRARRMTYDARGDVTLVEAGTTPGYTNTDWSNFVALQQQAAVYDGFGRPVQAKQQSAAGTTYGLVQTSYDAAGRPSCVAVRMNPAAFGSLPGSACTAGTAGSFGPDRISQLTYNSLGQVTATTRALGTADAATESATYTDNGLPESLTDGNGNVSIIEYDDFDRVAKMRYPDPTCCTTSTTDYELYSYDENSNVVGYRDRGAQTTATTYDDLNRPVTIQPPSSPDRLVTYDNLGRMTDLDSIAPNAFSLAWSYDVLGRPLSQTGGLTGAPLTLTSQYDIAGRRTRVTWPDSVYVTYDHDLYGATTDIRLSGSTSLSAYAYDDLGRLTGVTRGNGAATTYGYDAVSRLTSLAQNPTGSTNDVTVTLGYNPAGQIFSRAVSNSSYLYAPATGTTGYTVNGLNRVTVAGGTTVTYDSNGNVTAGLGASLGYDDQDNLASAAGTTTWLHDPLGRMFNQVVSGTTTRFAYDGMKLAIEYSGSSGTTIASRHVPGLWMDDIALSYAGSGTGTPSWPLTDERGSVIALTDGSGAVTGINTYDEYGVPASGNTGRFQYTGQIWLPTAGLYDYKMRGYAAGAGRFVQTDPLRYAAGANLYGYVGGNPISQIDPMGLQEVPPSTNPGEVIVNGRRIECDRQCIQAWLADLTAWFLQQEGSIETTGRAFFETEGDALQRICAAAATRPSGEQYYGTAGLSLVVIGGVQWGYTANATILPSGAISIHISETGNYAFGLNLFAGVSAGLGNGGSYYGSANIPWKLKLAEGFGFEATTTDWRSLTSGGATFGGGLPIVFSKARSEGSHTIDHGTFTVCGS